MDPVSIKKDLVAKFKKDTFSMVHLLRRFHHVSPEISNQVFEEEALNKPTQNVFNNLCYYLINIVDTKRASSLPWPLYDSSQERLFRSEVSSFINEYSSKGFLSPVMSSYLVNPACYKVTLFLFELSVLAVQKTIETQRQNSVMDEDYKNLKTLHLADEDIQRLKNNVNSKYTNYYEKQSNNKKIAQIVRDSITQQIEIGNKIQNYINNLIDGYLKTHEENEETRKELLKLKNVNETPTVINNWFLYHDERISEMENNWTIKTKQLFTSSNSLLANTEALVARTMGQDDKSMYRMEYNHKTDRIDTEELQKHVNNEEKHVLMNIEKNGILNFPNLIRSFVIAAGFIFKGVDLNEDITTFRQYLVEGNAKYKTTVADMQHLVERVQLAKKRLDIKLPATHGTLQLINVPPLSDFSKWAFNHEYHKDFVKITPFASRNVFNTRQTRLVKPNFKVPITPYLNGNRSFTDDFSKSLVSCCRKSHDPPQSVLKTNLTGTKRSNETIAGHGHRSGFTKEQLDRLFSTTKKRKSTLRKVDCKSKHGLFREPNIIDSDYSMVLFRSMSSPDLEIGENISFKKTDRKISLVPENSFILEVSGIAALDKDSGISTLDAHPENAQRCETLSLPTITVTNGNGNNNKKSQDLSRTEIEFNKELQSLINQNGNVSKVNDNLEKNKSETPKSDILIKKTGSIEKIINRFRKVRASMIPLPIKDHIPNIDEEVVRNDTESDSISRLNVNQNVRKNKRESLGAMLGVDDTFLDQFDLID